MRRMDWAACSPLPRVPGDSQSEKSTTGEKVITDVLSNDVLCKVFTHVTRDELCAGLPLTCQAFRSALRSSGELQRSLEHSWDPANCPKRAVRAGMCCPCARLVQPCHSRHSCEGSPCCEACTHACEGAMLCCARSFTLARAWSEAACTSALRSPRDTLRGANDGGSRRGSRGGSRPAARCAGAPRDGGAPARGKKKKKCAAGDLYQRVVVRLTGLARGAPPDSADGALAALHLADLRLWLAPRAPAVRELRLQLDAGPEGRAYRGPGEEAVESAIAACRAAELVSLELAGRCAPRRAARPACSSSTALPASLGAGRGAALGTAASGQCTVDKAAQAAPPPGASPEPACACGAGCGACRSRWRGWAACASCASRPTTRWSACRPSWAT